MNYTYPSIVFCSLSLLMFAPHFYIYSDYMLSLTVKQLPHVTHIRRIYSRRVCNDVEICQVWHYHRSYSMGTTVNTGRRLSTFSVPGISSVALTDVNQTFETARILLLTAPKDLVGTVHLWLLFVWSAYRCRGTYVDSDGCREGMDLVLYYICHGLCNGFMLRCSGFACDIVRCEADECMLDCLSMFVCKNSCHLTVNVCQSNVTALNFTSL
jgi:hypothetical protein